MKKILSTLFAIVILSSYQTTRAAEESCRIQDSPAPVLSEYIKNNRTIIKNITKEIKEAEKAGSFTKVLNYWQSNIIKGYNQRINWWNYGSYFHYYILFPVANDVTYQVKRDYRTLESENDWLNKYLKSTIKKWYSRVELTQEKVCNWIKWDCELSWTVDSILWEMLKNNSQVLHMYRKTVTWDNKDFDNIDELILIDKTALKKTNSDKENYMMQYYGPGNNCNKEEWKFLDKIKKIKNDIIERYQATYKWSNTWIQNWKDAWALASGIDSDKEKAIEKKLLAQELSRQWVPPDAASATLWALDTFNEEWFSPRKILTPIANTYKYLENSVKEQWDRFKKDVLDDAKESNVETKSISSLLGDHEQNTIDANIARSVAEAYTSLIPLTAETEVQTASLESRIINLHNNINLSIKTLSEETCENAVKVCNQQDKGNGNCWKCN